MKTKVRSHIRKVKGKRVRVKAHSKKTRSATRSKAWQKSFEREKDVFLIGSQGDQDKFEQLKKPAMKLGSAFQKVNFLRDIKDDSENLHRHYFPQIKGDVIDIEAKEMIIEEINKDFDEAYKGIVQLPLEAKFGVYTAYIYYKNLLRKLKKTEADEILEKRIRISNPMKMVLLTKSFVHYKLNLL